jgi:alcohol dehydrogenase
MRALYFDGKLSLREVDTPRIGLDEALIQVSLAGICGTDRQILKGYSSFQGIPGHEFVGRVVDTAEACWLGKRVVGEINVTCRKCEFCRRGLGRHCPNRTVMGIVHRPGAFAEFVALPIVNLHEVPAEIPDEAAVFAEPLAAAAEILEQLPIRLSTPVAVLGSGRLGLLVAQVLRHAGAEVTVIGRNTVKLELARSWGFRCSRPGSSEGSVLPPKSFAVVVEATGSPAGLRQALELIEPRGTVVMKSTFSEMAQFDTAKVVVDEIILLGSRCGNFVAALDLLRGGHVKVAPMVSATFGLGNAAKAFEYLEEPSCVKVLLSTDA